MSESEWFFKKHITGEHIAQSINAEFFKTDHIGNIPSAIIRESIQNSLDAKSEDQKKIMARFHIGATSRKYFNYRYFKGLSDHLKAQGSGIHESALSTLRKNIHYLTCEDFNTTGLCGDVKYADNTMPTEINDFYFFFRNDGRSGKSTSTDLGKWGVGKTIFPAISQLNMFWALTVRETDKKEYLMGRCILGHHSIGKTGYLPWGYYGKRDEPDSILVLPEDDPAIINEFKRFFQLKRDSESGLSIIIPFIEEEIKYESLVFSCIDQYMYPIVQGNLEISVSELRQKSVDINSDTIEDIIEEQIMQNNDRFKRLKSILKYIQYINNLPREDYILLNKPSLNSIPIWSKSALFDEETLADCQQKFDRGENLNFIVPVQIHYKDGRKDWGKFKLHLERESDLDISEDLFIRDGLKIPGVTSISGRKLRGIFVADQSPLTELLSSAENPAHTEWQPNAEGFKIKYENHDKVLSFIKNCFNRLTNILTKPLEDLDVDLLAEWFPFNISKSSSKKSTKLKKSKGKKGEKATPPVVKYIPLVTITKTAGGFKVIKNSNYLDEIEALEVMVAYHTVRGNPLKRYHPLDFSFENDLLTCTEIGVEVLEKEQNRVVYEISSQNFKIEINGFDENRDIYIKVSKVTL